MRAVIQTRYGSPEVLRLTDAQKPIPKDNEVLVRIHATVVTSEDCTFRKGDQLAARLLVTGLRRPRKPVLGLYLAGEVEAVGKQVKRFKGGDPVYGNTPEFGANAEYLCLPGDGALAAKPANLTYEEAVAVCAGTLTTLPFLRDKARVRRGQQVLVYGASGSLGTSAVQVAKYYGAEVTGVCSASNLDLIKSLGADKVVDYRWEDFTKNGQTYDVIFDTVGRIPFRRCRSSLKRNGIYLTTVPTLPILLQMLWTSTFGHKKAVISFAGLRPARDKARDLTFLRELVEAGTIKPVVDRQYTLEQIREAHAYVEMGHKKGNVAITVQPSAQ